MLQPEYLLPGFKFASPCHVVWSLLSWEDTASLLSMSKSWTSQLTVDMFETKFS